PQSVDIPPHCECMYFVHACTGEPAYMAGGQVMTRCGSNSSKCWNFENPYDRHCYWPPCELDFQLAVRFKNWDVCGKPNSNSCTVYVTQYLPLNPHLNGQLLGNWPGVWTTAPLNLNNYQSRTVLETCPGDQAILTLPDMYVPQSSGLCLKVNIRDESGSVVAQAIYDHNDVMGDQVDITNLFSSLGADIYNLEFILRCCDSEAALCVYNGSNKYTKRVWIEIAGEYSFSTNLSQGGGFTGCPLISAPLSPNPFGPLYDDVGDCDAVNLNFFNIVNPENSDLEITIFEIEDCDLQNQGLFIGSITETLPDGGSLILRVPPFASNNDCKCYRIDLEYETCGTLKMESYYYQVNGSNTACDNDLDGPGETEFLKGNESGSINSEVYPNPAENELYIAIQTDLEDYPENWDLQVFDLSGKQLMRSPLQFFGKNSEKIPINLPPGTYIYYLHADNHEINGTFISK
nr:T9SS type A sorting domain-containing protein [Saprospiraceae bacterium]